MATSAAGIQVADCGFHGREPCLDLSHKGAKLGLQGFILLEAELLLPGLDLDELGVNVPGGHAMLFLESLARCGLLGLHHTPSSATTWLPNC